MPSRYASLRAAVRDEPLPCALVDLDALRENARALAASLGESGKAIRLATKSLRCPGLVDEIRKVLGDAARGLMTYTAGETLFLAEGGERDLLLAYPTARPLDAEALASANATGARAAVVADSPEHLEPLSVAALARGVTIAVVLEVDVSWRPLGSLLHVGARRSPLRDPSDVVALARRVVQTPGLSFGGVMAYEAQIAGVPDTSPAVRAMKSASARDVARSRARVDAALRDAGLPPPMFNGGGSGSLSSCATERVLTEVSAGSGFLDSHLFDRYASLALRPAVYFAVQVVRRPAPSLVTCHGGGFVASGAAGPNRLPQSPRCPRVFGSCRSRAPARSRRRSRGPARPSCARAILSSSVTRRPGSWPSTSSGISSSRAIASSGRPRPTGGSASAFSAKTRWLVFLLPPLAALPSACGSSPTSHDARRVGPTPLMHFDRASFYQAPFPSDDLVKADGTIAIEAFPNPSKVPIVDEVKALAAGTHGFAEAGAVYFALSAPLPATAPLPTLSGSIARGATAFLVDVQPGSPTFLSRVPVKVRFDANIGPFGAPNLVSLLPLQGTPLRPRTRYAAVLTIDLGLVPGPEMTAIAGGSRPSTLAPGPYAEYAQAVTALGKAGVDAASIAGLAVFTTDDPTAVLATVLHDALAHVPAPDQPFVMTDVYDAYCVFASTLAMPDYQSGAAPYDFTNAGGAWAFDPQGNPVIQRYEEAGVVVTIPRTPMPAGGWPLAHFIRTGGGGSRPLVDRGTEATNGGPPIVAGSGPALYFALAGVAGASVDGPHEDLRNLTNGNEDFLMFNVFNPPALRDNVRESAVEYALFAHTMAALSIDVSSCPGATSPAKFDASKLALMGHSMGATIAPLSLAFEPLYRAAVLSGEGASWIENVMWKTQPLNVLGAIELLLGYITAKRPLLEEDPALTLFQWAEEPADTQAYTRMTILEPPAGAPSRHVLMEQGIVDHYIMPAIANTSTLTLGLDLAGPPLDATSPELVADGSPTLESVLPFSGRGMIAPPVTGNLSVGGQAFTGVVLQHPSDGIEDGHEIVFQTDEPKREYGCFLQSWAQGQTPRVPAPGPLGSPCE